MTGKTERGATMHVFVDCEDPDMVMVGIQAPNTRRFSSFPLSASEARVLAQWLTLGAECAESGLKTDQ